LTFVVLAIVQRVTGKAAACAIPTVDRSRSGAFEDFAADDLESTHADR
jgi:hypothetical protein